MNSVALNSKKNKRYLPHEVTTKVYSVKLYRQTKDIDLVCRRYHISKASLMRGNKLYDGTKESLMPKSHRPHSQHPNAHTEQELTWIRNYHRRNRYLIRQADICMCYVNQTFGGAYKFARLAKCAGLRVFNLGSVVLI